MDAYTVCTASVDPDPWIRLQGENFKDDNFHTYAYI